MIAHIFATEQFHIKNLTNETRHFSGNSRPDEGGQ